MKLTSENYNLAILDFGSSICRICLATPMKEQLAVKAFLCEPFRRYGTFNGRGHLTQIADSNQAGIAQNFYLEVIKKSSSKLIEMVGGVKILAKKKLVLGLPVDCLKARVVKVVYERPQEQKKISEGEAKNIYQKVFQQARDEILKNLETTGELLPQEIKFLRVRVLNIKISGYVVPQLVGFKGKRFDFQVLVIFFNNTIYQDYQRILADLGLKQYRIFHEAEGLLKCRASFSQEQTILVDVGSQFSQFFTYKDGLMEQTGEFRGGGADFSAALSEKLKISEEEAEEMKYKYASGSLSAKASEKIQKVFEPIALDWANNFKAAVNETRFNNYQMLFFGGGSMLPDLLKMAALTTGNSIKTVFPDINAAQVQLQDLPIINEGQLALTVREISSLLLGFAE